MLVSFLTESNAISESLLIILLIAILFYYLSILCKHLFYFQARVEQSVPFLLLSTFSSYYDARGKTSRTNSAVIHKPKLGALKTHALLVP